MSNNEYKMNEGQKNIEKVMVERRSLFLGIASILSFVEKETYYCCETIKTTSWDKGNEFCNDLGFIKYRKYTIENQTEAVLTHEYKSVYHNGPNGCTDYHYENMDRIIPYSEIEPHIDLLYFDYPYLKPFIDKVLDYCVESKGILPLEKVSELEQEYISENITAQKLVLK